MRERVGNCGTKVVR